MAGTTGGARARAIEFGAGGMNETSPLPVGTRAPDFTAEAGDGKTYHLADLLARGHVALFFYPGNNTPG